MTSPRIHPRRRRSVVSTFILCLFVYPCLFMLSIIDVVEVILTYLFVWRGLWAWFGIVLSFFFLSWWILFKEVRFCILRTEVYPSVHFCFSNGWRYWEGYLKRLYPIPGGVCTKSVRSQSVHTFIDSVGCNLLWCLGFMVWFVCLVYFSTIASFQAWLYHHSFGIMWRSWLGMIAFMVVSLCKPQCMGCCFSSL